MRAWYDGRDNGTIDCATALEWNKRGLSTDNGEHYNVSQLSSKSKRREKNYCMRMKRMQRDSKKLNYSTLQKRGFINQFLSVYQSTFYQSLLHKKSSKTTLICINYVCTNNRTKH
jgi:hypothetical protein